MANPKSILEPAVAAASPMLPSHKSIPKKKNFKENVESLDTDALAKEASKRATTANKVKSETE